MSGNTWTAKHFPTYHHIICQTISSIITCQGRAERVHHIPAFCTKTSLCGGDWRCMDYYIHRERCKPLLPINDPNPFDHTMPWNAFTNDSNTSQQYKISLDNGVIFSFLSAGCASCIFLMPHNSTDSGSCIYQPFSNRSLLRQSFGCLKQTYFSTQDRHKPSCWLQRP